MTENKPLEVGDLIIAESKLILDKDVRYFIFEEPVPSGALYIDEYRIHDNIGHFCSKYSSFSYQHGYLHFEPRYEKASYFYPSD
ncbi:MAG: hypothetical protein U9O65_00305 [Thermotogota bacterium]|nr:hypothetical protein [Thermotogota bacterium]